MTCEGYERIRSEDAFMALQRGDVIPRLLRGERAFEQRRLRPAPAAATRFCLVGEGALAALLPDDGVRRGPDDGQKPLPRAPGQKGAIERCGHKGWDTMRISRKWRFIPFYAIL